MLRAAAWVLILLFVAPVGYAMALRWLDPPTTWTIWRTQREVSSVGGKAYWKPIPLRHMGRHAPLAIIAAEDQEFARHHGFDVGAIRDAIAYNRRHKEGNRRRGGSTISQQTAKNVFLSQHRTWLRKGAEACFTMLIEVAWGKRRTLEIYLNCAEMGHGIFGIEAAAQRHFGKTAQGLNREEAALIAASLSSPREHDVRRPGPWLRKRQRWVMEQMRNLEGDEDIRALLDGH